MTTVYLGHGASGNAASMAPHVEGLHVRGIDARAVQLPVGKAEKAIDAYRQQVPDLTTAVIGGHSYGGRVASLLAAETPSLGLVLLSYPLHRPGQPEGDSRVPHWPRITCPVLLLSGESDAFARIDLLRKAVELLPNAELVTYPRLGHGMGPMLDDALDRIAAFVRTIPTTTTAG
jgi:predicted alpha/beta-hydrolase family hydrolase